MKDEVARLSGALVAASEAVNAMLLGLRLNADNASRARL